jgi:hypothetical protein
MKTQINLDQLKSIVNKIKNDPFDKTSIYCHPDNLKVLKDISNKSYPEEQYKNKYNYYNSSGAWFPPLYGIEIFTDKNLERYTKHWKFPEPPAHWSGDYWEYTKDNEEWAIPIGHGHWEYDEATPVFYIVKTNPYKYDRYYLDKFLYSSPLIDKDWSKKLILGSI